MWLSGGWEGKKESLFGNRDAAGSVKMSLNSLYFYQEGRSGDEAEVHGDH